MSTINIRKDFPILDRIVNDEPLVYLDNAATTQKPKQVIEAINHYYETSNANIHRGVHTLAQEATDQYEAVREQTRRFINASSTKEVLFTRGTTTSLNWVAQGFVKNLLEEGDEIWVSPAEHHSNLVPWQQIARQTKARVVYMPLLADGQLDMATIHNTLHKKVKVMAIAQASNVLGTINDVKTLAKWMHAYDHYIVVDGAQSTPHMAIDVQDLDCDFFAFSGHKMLAPTGIGVLYGKQEHLEQMEPVEFGGEMIDFVYDFESTWNELPWKFEAGTPNIAGAIGLGAAISYLEEVGMDNIHQYETRLVEYVLPRLQAIEGIEVFGPTEATKRSGVISFNLNSVHPHDLATAMDMEGVAIRAGHHCAQPLMRWLDQPATARASFYAYNTLEEAEFFINTVKKVKAFFEDFA